MIVRRSFLFIPGIIFCPFAASARVINTTIPHTHPRLSYRRAMDYIEQAVGGFKPGSLILLAARPSHGKTSLMWAISWHLARKRNCSTAYHGADPMFGNLLSQRCNEGDNVQSVFTSSRKSVEKHFVEASKTLNHLDLITIDNMIEFSQHPESSTRAGETLMWLKRLTTKLHTSAIVSADLVREVDTRDDQRPRITDLTFDYRVLRQADYLILLYKDAPHQDATVEISMSYGQQGIIMMEVINLRARLSTTTEICLRTPATFA